MSGRQPRLKQIAMILSISCHLHFHFTEAAFPIEWDVAELTGVSPLKRWTIFMEKLTKVCLNDIKTKDSTCLTDILECMTKKNITKSLHRKYSSCRITHLYPSILHAESHLSLQIIVHHSFNLNVTVMYYLQAYNLLRKGEFYLTISAKRYTRLVYPFTFMSSNNSLEITFPLDIVIFIGIEYSIGQKFNLTSYS